MNNQPIRNTQRTKYQAEGDTCYSIRYLHLQERLFNKLAYFFTIINLICGGGTALVLSISDYTAIAVIFGVLVTISTVLDYVMKPDEKAQQCRDVRLCFQKLLNASARYSLEEYDVKAGEIGQMKAPTIEGLQFPAYIDSVTQRGHTYNGRGLDKWERFLKLIA